MTFTTKLAKLEKYNRHSDRQTETEVETEIDRQCRRPSSPVPPQPSSSRGERASWTLSVVRKTNIKKDRLQRCVWLSVCQCVCLGSQETLQGSLLECVDICALTVSIEISEDILYTLLDEQTI